MGQRGQAWVTCVTRSDKGFVRALVLAESLKRTKTTKRIVVIVVSQLGKSEIKVLYNAFDDVIFLNDSLISSNNGKGDELRGKIFSFSLEAYEKCVFLAPDTIMLENSDKLFEEPGFSGTYFNGESDDMFLFTPKWMVCEFLMGKYEQSISHATTGSWNNFITKSVQAWMTNNELGDSWKGHVELSAVKFSMKTGRAVGARMSDGLPAAVQFVDAELYDKEFVEVFHQLKSKVKDLGLLERVIMSTWMDIAGNGVSGDMLELNPRIQPNENYQNEPIAIVGMSCRLPKANNLEEFWNLLYDGKEGVQYPPSFRWKNEHSIFGGSAKERNTRAGFLSNPVDEFDAKFFGLSPKEAMFLDPQARLLHELVWEGLENSGIDPLSLRGSHAGIFTGSWLNDYKDMVQTSSEKDFFRTYMGNSGGVTPARLSFMLGVTGPSIATESGCSSAIVAVDLAVKSLRNGETNLAIAGGVNLLLHRFQGDLAEYVVSPDGRCKTFDADANGFARAEGCGVLVLKRLSDAIRDRDNIWAMIRGSAITQEGLSRSLGTPTVDCEALAMKLALEDADVMPEQVSFVESHGTGTIVGDPMEIAAITQTYGSKRRSSPLVIGSVKTNVGHTESCSGITGIIKTVLAMHHEIIPKHLNLQTINPQINLDAIPATIPLEPISWPKQEGVPRLAGVSSFGITGTDAHVVIQEPPKNLEQSFKMDMERPMHFLKFSGKTLEALDEVTSSYQQYFSKPPTNISFADVAYTANTGRASFSHRAFILASDFEQAAKTLQEDKFMKGETRNAEKENICFLFTGQASQYTGMAKSLYDSSPIFRLNFDYCDSLLRDLYSLSIRDTLWGEASQELNRTIYSQTSIFCIEYCLLKLWESWGIRPDYVLGHSLGEFCAVVAAGIISFEDALKLVVTRSQLIDKLETGSMLVIRASLQDVEQLLEDQNILLDIAAVNSSEQTVVAGDTDKILHLLDLCKMRSIKAVKLEATHAFHSRHMDSILNEYRQVANTIMVSNRSSSYCQYISGMDGKLIEDPSKELNAEYWIRHTREKVSFLESCRVLKRLGCQNYLEIGPQPVLSTFVMQNIELSSPINCYQSLRRNTSDWETILTSLGKLYLEGYPINWEGFDKPYMRKRIPSLPTYPFQRKSFWVDCGGFNITYIHPLIGYHVFNASPLNIFHNNLSLKAEPHLKDHCIGNRIVMPGAAFAEMCLSAGHCVANSLRDHFEPPTRPIALENMTIEAPLELKDGKSCRVQVIVEPPSNNDENSSSDEATHQKQGFCVKVFHQKNSDTDTNGKWILHATATFHLVSTANELVTKWNFERIAEMMSEKESPLSNGFYKRFADAGLKFGDSYKSIKRFWKVEEETGNDEIVAEIPIPMGHEDYILHPIINDAMLQTGTLTRQRSNTEALRVPVKIGQLIWLGNIGANGDKNVLYLHAWWKDGKCSVLVVNEDLSTPVAYLSDIELVETNVRTIESILEQQNSLLPDMWEEIWKPISGPHENRAILADIEQIFTSGEFSDKIETADPNDKKKSTSFNQVNKLICLYMIKALIELGWDTCLGDKIVVADFCKQFKILSIYQKLVAFYFSVFCDEKFMEYNAIENSWKVVSIPPNNQALVNDVQELEKLLEVNENMKTSLKFYQNIGRNLPQILLGNESPIQLLFPTDPNKQDVSTEMYYQNQPGKPDIVEKLTLVMEGVLQKWRKISGEDSSKKLRILEVGAGTGCTSEVCLPIILNIWGQNFEYYFTDISAAFFSKAEKKLEEFQRNLKYAVFDIEENPFKQGIPLNYFDMVIAQDVIHTAKSLKESVENLKATLRPQGITIIGETISQNRELTFSFGLFEDYWRFQDYDIRQSHPCVNVSKWKQVLHEVGFKYSYATEAYFGTFGIFCGQIPSTSPINEDIIDIIGNGEIIHETREKKSHWIVFSSPNTKVITRHLYNKLQHCGMTVTLMQNETHLQNDFLSEELAKLDVIFGSDNNVQGIIYAIGMDDSITDQNIISRPLLHIIKKLISVKKPPRLYIFTKGGHAINPDHNPSTNPSVGTLFGMVKSLKNESADTFVRYVDFDEESDDVKLAEEILYELALFKDSEEKERIQTAYRDGQRYAPRFTKIQRTTDELKLPSCCEKYRLMLPKSRMIQDLEFDVLEEDPLGENEVEVKVEAYALNFRDIVTILKPIAQFENLNTVGLDFSGVVTKVGDEVLPLQVGDRVFGVNLSENSALHSHLVLKANHLIKIPDRMTFCEAASLPAVYVTSLHCLVNVAQLKAGETVLIHTGSGGVGLSAIQVARKIGARIITTAGNKRKRAYLRENLGIEHVFHSRDTSFEQEIMKVTNGRGVDVVLNSITGPGMKESSLNVCCKGARFVEMSKLSVWSEEEVKALRPDVKYKIVDLTKLEVDCWTNLLNDMQNYLHQDSLKVLPYTKFDALRIKQALQYFQKANHIGKVLVTMPKVSIKDGEWTTQVILFNLESTYIITGGLGGIGFEVCKWMLEKGATDIVLIGRNPPKPEVAKEIERLQTNKKCKILVKLGDVGDFDTCKAIIEDLIETGCKPIRGIQHCAGVLRDNLYVKQTWEAYEATFRSKVNGTWNLHNLTKDMPLEHFILYSSLTANVGSPAQSNHSAANCFEDAFAHYRYSLGLPSTSINWGQWSQVGCATEVKIAGVWPISVQPMLSGLEVVLRTNKVQQTIVNFESYDTFVALCPMFKHYVNERLLKNEVKQYDQFWEEMDSADNMEDKMEILCGYLKSVLRNSLRMEADEPISEDADLRELGVDSLMAIEFKNSIQSFVGSRLIITVNMVKDCRTIRDFATVVVSKIQDDIETNANELSLSPEEYQALLENDCQLDDKIQAPSKMPCKATAMKTILITGVTGQLGPYILSLLRQNRAYQSVENIVCLIRTREGNCPKERLQNVLSSMKLEEKVDMSKVECIRGDVTLPNFGLEPERYAELCSSVDGIIHLAVKANHLEMYRNVEKGTKDIRSVNVGGTLNVLRFAATTKTKHVYYAGVIGSTFSGNNEGTLSDDWQEHHKIKAVVDHKIMGYLVTKYVCEMLMKQANERGIPCKVFRLPWITGESETGRVNYKNNHYLLRFLSYLKIKSIPDAPFPAVVLPVDVCADLSLKLFFNDETPNEVYNIAHPSPELEVEFMHVAKEHFGVELEIVDWKSKEFAAKLYATGMPLEALKEIYEDVDRMISIVNSGAFQGIQGYLTQPETFFINKKVEKYIPDFSANIPTSTMDAIKRSLEFVRSEGLFEKYGL